jgi:pepF/M3 family oligoendopeptidase
MSTMTDLPTWNTTALFSGLDGEDFLAAKRAWTDAILSLEGALNANEGKDDPAALASFLQELNQVMEEGRELNAFVMCFVSTNSRNERALAAHSEMQPWNARLRKIGARLVKWVGSVDLNAAVAAAPALAEHEFVLRRMQEEARHQMSLPEEQLAADLDITGGSAWGRLRDHLTSQLVVEVPLPTGMQRMGMSQVRNLAYQLDREVRRMGYEAEMDAWRRNELVFASAMNSIKGQVLTLCERRGWESPLDETLFYSNMDRTALEAMLSAARTAFPVFRRYLKAKAKALGLDRLAWYDLFAPVGEGDRWDYSDAQQFVADRFGDFSADLKQLALRAFDEDWVDVPPRDGKRDGAFCMGVRRGESRVLLNYEPTFNWVGTLAHELGHAYHNWCLRNRTPLQRQTPMTLAETASIFCEQIVRRGALEEATPSEQLVILEDALRAACQVVVDITSRYLFESRCFEKRRERELSAGEMCELMRSAQEETYGDGLTEDLHPYMWAAKPHYYSSSRSFYNFPYMFGLLFGLGLYAHYQREAEGFVEEYNDLLASTGMADAATLAARFDIDIRSESFWESSLAVIAEDVERYERLVG